MTTQQSTLPTTGLLDKCLFNGGEISGSYGKSGSALPAEYRLGLRISHKSGAIVTMERTCLGMHTARAFFDSLPNLTFEHDLESLIGLLHALKFKEVYASRSFFINDGSVAFSVRDVVYDGMDQAEVVCTLSDDQDRVATERYIHCSSRQEALDTITHLAFFMTESCMIANATAIIEHIDNDACVAAHDRTWL